MDNSSSTIDNVIINLFFDDDNMTNMLLENLAASLSRPLSFLQQDPSQEQVGNVTDDSSFEAIVPDYNDVQFQEHFAMQRESAEALVQILGNSLPFPETMAPLRKKLLYSLWILTKQESFSATSKRFDLPVSSGHLIFRQIIEGIFILLPQYIVWPGAATYKKIALNFRNRSHGFPGIIGAIDCCHIPCKQPIGNEIDYHNSEGFHSIILQGTCDHSGKFIDIFVGSPGKMNDATVFRNSQLCLRMGEPDFISSDYHLIGDVAFPLKVNLMTPFRNAEDLTAPQIIYNTKLNCVHSIIGRAFGHLKAKFKRLNYLNISDFELGNNTIAVACMLHNFILERNYDSFENDTEEISTSSSKPNQHQEEEDDQELAAILKRDSIVSSI